MHLIDQTIFDAYDGRVIQQLITYRQLLQSWGKTMNLTAILDDEGIILRHFADSAAGVSLLKSNESVIDVGSGAGFPGLVLAILRPDLQITLLEPTGKRCRFLSEVVTQLDLKQVVVVNQRAEIYVTSARAQFDLAVSRAVAALPILLELSLPLVRPEGRMLAWKGPEPQEELQRSAHALRVLHATLSDIHRYELGDQGTRSIIEITKTGPTDHAYPRPYGKIKAHPL